jgi:carboxyl-terminal processing protease
MSSRTRLLVLLVSTPLVAFVIIGGLLGKASAREDSYQHLRVFEDVVSLIMNNYVEEVDVARVMEGAMRGLADGLDADSSFLTADDVARIERNTALPAGDSGLELTRQYYLRIIAARDGSPAAKAGLRTGDYVRAIDGRSTRDMSLFEGTRRLRGAVGSKVTLTVLRGSAAEPHEVVLVRTRDAPVPVTSRMAAPGVGYLRVAAFGPATAGELSAQIATLRGAGASHVVIDLRGTAQGSVDAALSAARLFVKNGTLAQREARGTILETLTATGRDGVVSLPVTILATAGTSGPAEVFASALTGNDRADIVGERTLGRAGEQKLVKLPDGSGLWMTWARYLTPAGKAIHGTGLEPTEAIDDPDVEFGGPPPAADPILDKALARAAAREAA